MARMVHFYRDTLGLQTDWDGGNFAEFKTELGNYFSTAPDKFVEVFNSELSYSEINIKDLPLAIKVQKTENTYERIEVIDVERSVETFKSIID